MPLTARFKLSAVMLLSLVLAPLSHAATLSDQIEALTGQLRDVNDQYAAARRGDREAILKDLITLVSARKQLLIALIQENPAEAIRIAVPAKVRANFPTLIQDDIEQEFTTEGIIEVLHEDRDQDPHYLYFLWTASDSRYSLYFAASPPTVKTGDRVRISSLRVKRLLAVPTASSSVTTLSTALPNTLGAQRTLMILVTFRDYPIQPYTPDAAQSMLGATSDYEKENSYQQTWLVADVAGWYRLPMESSVCEYGTLASYAKSAATSAGINVQAYARLVYAFPQNACRWWALATLGGNPSQAWINGSLQLRVLGHVFGHNFGLFHSHSLKCGSVTIGTACTTVEYGDMLDIMGGSSAHLNAYQKERLGWLNSAAVPPIITVQSSGTYLIEPYESNGPNPKALKILKDGSTKTWYYVEYRRALGFDAFLSRNSNVVNGVVIHTGTETNADSSNLLDMTPATTSSSDAALGAGRTFADPVAGITISTRTISMANASVTVFVNTSPCISTAPAVTLSTPQIHSVLAGSSVSYTVSVMNRHGPSCGATTFWLSAVAPQDWRAAFGTSSLTVNPGSIASTSLVIASSHTAKQGRYTVGAAATNSADSTIASSASATYTIEQPVSPACESSGRQGNNCRF